MRGEVAITDSWKIGLAAQPPLRFELIEVFRGAGMICLLYRSVTRNRRLTFRIDMAEREIFGLDLEDYH